MKKWIVILALLFLAVTVGYFKFHTKKAPLVTETVKYGDITQSATAIGDIEPLQTSMVKSQVAGIVKHIYHNVGEYVHKGDKLVDLNPYPPPTTTAQDIKNIRTDEANLVASQAAYNSYAYLYKQKVLPKNYSQFVTARQNLTLAKAALKYDQQVYQLNQKGQTVINGKVVGSTVFSPTDGFIIQKMINVGDSVNSLSDMQAATALFSVANMKDLIFKGSVDEIDSGKVQSGMSAKITVAAHPKKILTGKVSIVSLQSEKLNTQQSGNALATTSTASSPFDNGFRLEITNISIPKTMKLRSGFSATANITLKHLKHVIVVPERMLVFKQDKVYVNVPVNQYESKPQLIKIGISDGSNAEVLKGLKIGDKIVAPGSYASK